MLKEKHTLAKLKAELEGRKGKLCRCCKKFGHLACNCRSKKEGEKGVATPQNKFEILSSRIMQCGVEEKVVRNIRIVVVRCFSCGEEGHKSRVCPQKEKKEYRVVHPYKRKVHQEKKPAHLARGKAQKCGEKEVRKVGEGEAAHPVKGEVQQGE